MDKIVLEKLNNVEESVENLGKSVKKLGETVTKLASITVTKNDLRKELSKYTTKTDLDKIRKDLKGFATKKDLEQFATKKDLEQGLTKIQVNIIREVEDLSLFIKELDEHKAEKSEVIGLEERVGKLEKELHSF